MQRYPREYFLQRVMAGEFYLALDEQEKPAGIMALLTEDPRWEGSEPKNCYYVHHLAARTGAKGAAGRCYAFVRSFPARKAARWCGWTASWGTGS